jgi:hypothetical protein
MKLQHDRLENNRFLHAQIIEQCNEHAVLQISFPPGAIEGRGYAGTEISLLEAGEPRFKGIITRADTRTGNVTAKGYSVAHDLADVGLRVFPASVDCSPINQLAGFKNQFSWLEWGELGQLSCGYLCQFRESDWRFVRRIAALESAYLVASPTSEAVMVRTNHESLSHRLTADDIATGSDFVVEELTQASSNKSIWNVTDSTETAKVHRIEDLSLSEQAVHSGLGELGCNESEWSACHADLRDSASEFAARDALLRRGRIELWGARLRNQFEVGLNHQIQLDATLGAGSFTVWRRVLTFAGGNKYLDIECRNSKAGFPEVLDLLRSPPVPVVVFGKVILANDSLKRGRVQVQLAGNDRSRAAWCLSPQPFLGVCQTPSLDDQVAVLIEPHGMVSPFCLGAVYHKDVQVSGSISNPEDEKLIFELPNLLSLIAHKSKGEIRLKSGSLTLCITPQKVTISRE